MKESEKELLISRFVQGEAGEEEWDRLTALAGADPALWRQVAEAKRDQDMLTGLMDRAGAVADAVEAPAGADAGVIGAHPLLRLRWWAGWAVAALILLAWAVHFGQQPTTQPAGSVSPPAVATAGFTAQEAFQSYLDKGRAEGSVLSEHPRRVIIQTRPAPSGEGFEVIFIQQVMEKTTVPNLYRYSGQDEYGRPTLVRWEGPVRERM